LGIDNYSPMRVIHDPPYRPTKGKLCIIAESPVNCDLQR
jgi:hypothetical protein